MVVDYAAILDAFLASDEFPEAIRSTTLLWGRGDYKVELLPAGTWRVHWSGRIGNLYETPGIMLSVPPAPEEWGDLSDDDVLAEAIAVNRDEIAQEMREALSDKLIGTAQAADVLGVHPGHVRKLIAAGTLTATKVGRDHVVKHGDLAHVVRRPVGRPKRS